MFYACKICDKNLKICQFDHFGSFSVESKVSRSVGIILMIPRYFRFEWIKFKSETQINFYGKVSRHLLLFLFLQFSSFRSSLRTISK